MTREDKHLNVGFQIPAEYKFIYLFHGTVHPVRANVSLFDLGVAKIGLKTAKSSVSAFMKLKGEKGGFEVTVYTAEEIIDLLTLRNLVRDHVDARVNVLGFFQGTYYEAEIVACTPPSSARFDFSVELPAISELCKTNNKRVSSPQKLISHPSFPHFAAAIKDFKMAMREPSDSFFLVYRAIETIRVHFANLDGIDSKKDKNKSWENLRARMKYEKTDFDFILSDAEARRHGDRPLHTEEEIVQCLNFGWLFLYKFLEITFGGDFIPVE